ncbi:MAG: Imm26 family immunity protein [Phycisphaerae bacterium]
MRLPYAEWSVFCVPLNDGGYARGVVARATKKGKVLLGYFFGPRLATVDAAILTDLDPQNSVLRITFGDLGLIRREWPILGVLPNWNRSAWPMPDVVRRDPLGRLKPVLVRYSDDDPNRIEMERVIDNDIGLAPDSMYGYGAVRKSH